MFEKINGFFNRDEVVSNMSLADEKGVWASLVMLYPDLVGGKIPDPESNPTDEGKLLELLIEAGITNREIDILKSLGLTHPVQEDDLKNRPDFYSKEENTILKKF